MQHRLTRALWRPRRRRRVEFRLRRSPRDVLIGLPLRPPADTVAGMVKITAIQGV